MVINHGDKPLILSSKLQMMDFDKQYGNGAPASMINKGRGFTEKPIIKPAVVHRQPRARSAPRKVTAKTQLYFHLSAY